jgi:hypothetical protein
MIAFFPLVRIDRHILSVAISASVHQVRIAVLFFETSLAERQSILHHSIPLCASVLAVIYASSLPFTPQH